MYIEYRLSSRGRDRQFWPKNNDTLEINYNKKQYQFAIPGVIYFTQSISKTYDITISFDTITGKQINVIVLVMNSDNHHLIENKVHSFSITHELT